MSNENALAALLESYERRIRTLEAAVMELLARVGEHESVVIDGKRVYMRDEHG